jgi:flagellar M-ring protein FliF
MADNLPKTMGAQFAGLSRLSAHRQFGLVLGLAVVLALGVAVVMWASKPNFVEIMSATQQAEYPEAQRILDRADIPNKVHARTRALMVPHTQIAHAETVLLAENLLGGGSDGYKLLDEPLSIGTSRFQENSRYLRAMQGEIEQTISAIAGVSSARVMIAMPPDTGFLRDRDPVKASVSLTLRSGPLSDAEVEGIVEYVAGSVPRLESSNVRVVDHTGVLLSKGSDDGVATVRSEQLAFKRQIEEQYRGQIRDILGPVLGPDRLQVAVDAAIDFTLTETASENYGSEEPAAVVSESSREDASSAGTVGGVPGSMTNQPPAAGVISDVAAEAADAVTTSDNGPQTTSRSSTRNYQPDRIVSHVKQAGFALTSLSISVIVDDREVIGDDGAPSRVPRTREELDRFAGLVRSAVGFNADRGDSLTIESETFRLPEPLQAPPPLPIWQQAWFLQVVRYASGAIGALLLLLFVVRPVLKSLAAVPPAPRTSVAAVAGGAPAELVHQAPNNSGSADAALGRARKVAEEDPKLVAQVVRRWIDSDGK